MAVIKHCLEYGKDIVGLLGTILATIPFLKDWWVKEKITTADQGRGLSGDLTFEAFKAIANKYRNQFFEAGKTDLLLILLGLLLILLSFIFSLILTYIS